MWILNNSKELLENLKTQALFEVNSIKTFDFSTLYTTITHGKLNAKLKEIINNCFFHKTEIVGINTLFLGIWIHISLKDYSNVNTKYSEVDVIKMLEFLKENIYVEFSG